MASAVNVAWDPVMKQLNGNSPLTAVRQGHMSQRLFVCVSSTFTLVWFTLSDKGVIGSKTGTQKCVTSVRELVWVFILFEASSRLSNRCACVCWRGTDGTRHATHITFSHVVLIAASLCFFRGVSEHMIMFVHVVCAPMILCGCVAAQPLANRCLNIAFLRVRLCSEWEFAVVQSLLALTCVTFSNSPNAGLHHLGACQLGLHQVVITSSISRDGAAASASCWGSEDLTWLRISDLL